jgi:hypothetical protein
MPTPLGCHRLIGSRQRQSGDARHGCRYPMCSLHSDLQAFARSLRGQARSGPEGSHPGRHSSSRDHYSTGIERKPCRHPAIPRAVFSAARSPPLSHGSACACRAHRDRGRPSDDGGPALTERTVKLPPPTQRRRASAVSDVLAFSTDKCSPRPTLPTPGASLAPCLGAILKIKLRLLRAGAAAGIEIKSLHLASMP